MMEHSSMRAAVITLKKLNTIRNKAAYLKDTLSSKNYDLCYHPASTLIPFTIGCSAYNCKMHCVVIARGKAETVLMLVDKSQCAFLKCSVRSFNQSFYICKPNEGGANASFECKCAPATLEGKGSQRRSAARC